MKILDRETGDYVELEMPVNEELETVKSEILVLKVQLAEQNQIMSDFMDYLFTAIPEI